MDIESVRRFCLSIPLTTEDMAFRERHKPKLTADLLKLVGFPL